MICLYVSGVFYRLLVAVLRGLFGREHAYVFQESCIDRYHLALDMLIAVKNFSRFPFCNTSLAVMLESATSDGLE